MLIYTGVGSRKTPLEIQKIEEKIAKRLCELGYFLRSGGAIGSDVSFERGASKKEIYYADERSAKLNKGIFVPYIENDPATNMISKIHPAWNICSDYAKALHRRNIFQVLGENMDTPSEFLLCWTPCGAESAKECVYSKNPNLPSTGGTATAIRVADANGVSVFNFAKTGRLQDFFNYMKSK